MEAIDLARDYDARRKPEREAIAREFLKIAEEFGATVKRRDTPGRRGSIALTIACQGVGALINITGLHGGGGGLISWHNSGDHCRDFASGFRVAVMAPVTLATHKATSCGTWAELEGWLRAGMARAADGRAFVEGVDHAAA